MAALAAAHARAVVSGGWFAGPSTLMEVLGMARAEVANCRIVRWLFDPLAWHGIGESMITALADHIGVTMVEPALVRATAEVARVRSRADLVLEDVDRRHVVVFEAKIDAAEGHCQAERVEHDWPEATRLVFLTVPGARIPGTAREPNRWQPLSWRWIADAASSTLAASEGEPSDSRRSQARAAVFEWVAHVTRNLL